MASRAWKRALSVLAVAALAAPSGATLILPQDLGQLTAGATDVIRGRVVSLASRWDHERTLIVTDVRVAVAEAYKGSARGEVVLTLHGGRVEDLVLDVVGAPGFAVGEEVLVFARREAGGVLTVPSLYQGKYRIEAEGGRLWVSNVEYSLAELLPQRAAALDGQGRLSWDLFRVELERAARPSSGGAR
jgi:hypothetical protein